MDKDRETVAAAIPRKANVGNHEKRSARHGDFYVASDGNDANTGSESAPFTSLERARDAARALRDGRAAEGVLGHDHGGDHGGARVRVASRPLRPG